MPANLENSAVATVLKNVNFHSSPKERQCQRMFKLLHNCTQSHMQVKYCSKFSQLRLQQYVNCELPDVQAGKGRRTRDQIANICWIIKKAREFQKNIYFCFIDYAKAFYYVDHNKLWKILKEMGIPDRLTWLLRNLYAGQEAAVRTGRGTTAAAAKSLQSCPTLCNPIDGSPLSPGFSRQEHWSGLPFPSPVQESEKLKVKLLSHVWLLETPWTAAYQAPPCMGFSR